MLNNLLFLGITFAIFWGTVFPLVSEALQGSKLTVGPPYFNQTVGPLMLLLILLMGIGPLMPWRKSSPRFLLRAFLPPALTALAVVLLAALLGARDVWASAAIFACAFTATVVLLEFGRGARARSEATGDSFPRALGGLIRRNHRRYGGYIVHLGIVVIALAMVSSHVYQIERQVSLKPGELVEVAGYRLRFDRLEERQEPGVRVVAAPIALVDGGRSELLLPTKNFHQHFERQPATGVAIRTTPREDLYVVLTGWEPDGAASFLIFVNPLVVWIWIGGVVVLLGSVITLWPARSPTFVPAARPSGAYAPQGAR
jgi:cytochrome c-type biogenesis protein CcmF